MSQSTLVKVITWVVVVLMLITAFGAIAYFAKDNTPDEQEEKPGTFYVSIDGENITMSSTGYELAKNKPLTVDIHYPTAEVPANGYSLKVVPNALSGKDFDFTVDGIAYSFQEETDLTAGFDIEYESNLFTITPKGTLNEVMAAVYPNSEVSDISSFGYDNMFMLVIEANHSDATISIAFSVVGEISGIVVYPDHIYF